jgi:hypothetical protein
MAAGWFAAQGKAHWFDDRRTISRCGTDARTYLTPPAPSDRPGCKSCLRLRALDLEKTTTPSLHVLIDARDLTEQLMTKLGAVLYRHRGRCKTFLWVEKAGGDRDIFRLYRRNVSPSPALLDDLDDVHERIRCGVAPDPSWELNQ